MLPSDASEEMRAGLLQPEIMKAPAVFLASDASEGMTGRRLVATEWNMEHPMGKSIAEGIG